MKVTPPVVLTGRSTISQARQRREMHDLAMATFERLETAGFDKVAGTLRTRVFARTTNELFEVVVAEGVPFWRFKPMVELLLRHLLDLAGRDSRPALTREAELREAFDLAGF